MLTDILSQLPALVLPLLVAPLAVLLGKLALNLDRRIDALAAPIKQVIVFVISAVLTVLAQHVGVGFLPDGAAQSLSGADWQIFASWLAALVLHDGVKKTTVRR